MERCGLVRNAEGKTRPARWSPDRPFRDAYWGDKSTESVEFVIGAEGARRTLIGTVVPGHDTTGRVESVIVFCREK